MTFRYIRRYVGRVQACVLDWSGTTADKYVLAPAVTFCQVFQKYGVPITMQEAREPMGLRKDLHIKAIFDHPGVQARWRQVHGRNPDDSDVQKLYKDFIPLQISVLKQYAELIPGAVAAGNSLRKLGCKIGMTTGFISSMGTVLREEAEKQGFRLDAHVAGDDVQFGVRPRPFMLFRNLELMDVADVHSVIKVDDTTSGMGEGLAAGCWTVGVARYSNYMDVDSLEDAERLTEREIQFRLQKSRDILAQAGAHYVVDSIADLTGVVEDINARLARGDQP